MDDDEKSEIRIYIAQLRDIYLQIYLVKARKDNQVTVKHLV